MAFVSYFSTADADASNLPTVKHTPRSRIRYVIVVAPIDSLKTLTTYGCLYFATHFHFILALSASDIPVFGATK